jgi:hypothetical protein
MKSESTSFMPKKLTHCKLYAYFIYEVTYRGLKALYFFEQFVLCHFTVGLEGAGAPCFFMFDIIQR